MRYRSTALTAAALGCAFIGCNASAQDFPPSFKAPAYSPENIVARTVHHKAPAVVLYEDAHVIAWLADRPLAKGHFLVASKVSKARSLLGIEPAELARIMAVVRRVAAADLAVTGANGFVVRQSNGSATSVGQFHVHVITRWQGDQMAEGPASPVSLESLDPLGAAIRAQLARKK